MLQEYSCIFISHHGAANYLVMDSINYLSPDFSFQLTKSENLSSLFQKPNASNDLIKCIDANDLSELRQYFFPTENNKSPKAHLDSQQFDYKGISLNKEEFVNAILQIYGNDHLKLAAIKFFEELQIRKIITNSIFWCHIINMIIEKYKTQRINDSFGEDQSVLQLKKRHSLPHSKDSVFKILVLDTANSFCYTVISMCGKIGIYDENLDLCNSYEIPQSSYRKINKWISSASYTCSGCGIFLSTIDRSLYIYNTSRLNHRLRFIISEFPNIITCMQFCHQRSNGKLLLLVGDDLGNISFFTFHQHLKSFFEEQPNKEVACYFWSEIKNQMKWVTFQFFNKLHQEFVMDIEYIPKKNIIISFSKDTSANIVITHLGEKKMIMTAKLRKGLLCFAYDNEFGFLATSSSDAFISLWSSNDLNQPINKLFGHKKIVTDLHFMKNIDALLSISEEGALKLWSMENFKCLQTIQVELCSSPKNYLGSKIIFERLIPDLENPTNKKSMNCEVLVTSARSVTIFSTNNKSEHCPRKPLPIRNLEPKIPNPKMIFKHYNRENPLSFQDLCLVKVKEGEKLEERTDDLRQFIIKGAPHLGLIIRNVKENIKSDYENLH